MRNLEFVQESADGRAIESSQLLLSKRSGARPNAKPILHCLRCHHEVNKSIFGLILNPSHVDIITHFYCSFGELMDVFVVKKTSKAHIQMVHVPQFIAYTNFPLRFTSEHVAEAQNSFYNALYHW